MAGCADLATDGRWCFVALWVRPRWFSGDAPTPSTWALLKQRLEDICPSAVSSLLPRPPPPVHLSERLMLLQVCSIDRTGLLNGESNSMALNGILRVLCFDTYMLFLTADVSQKLWELEFTIHKVKVSTSPEERSINFFFVTDNRYGNTVG